ncbi:putative aldehyde dehydrogenase (NAD(P)(+)) [Dioscorea sansibarensis]
MASECNSGQGFKIKFNKLFINGQFIDSISEKTFKTIDPRNEEIITRVAEGDKEDVDAAVKAARQAFDHGPWPRMSAYERGRMIMKLADLIEEHIEELSTIDTLDAGKLHALGKALDIPGCSSIPRYYAGAADKIHGETLKMSGQFHAYTLREPIGGCGSHYSMELPFHVLFY